MGIIKIVIGTILVVVGFISNEVFYNDRRLRVMALLAFSIGSILLYEVFNSALP